MPDRNAVPTPAVPPIRVENVTAGYDGISSWKISLSMSGRANVL